MLSLNKFYELFFSGSGHESRSGHHAFDCIVRTRYEKYVRSYIQWTCSLAHASQFLHYHTYTKSRRKNKSYLLLLPNLSCNFGLWREFLLFLPLYVPCTTIILPPKKTTMGQNPLWNQIGLFSYSYLLQLSFRFLKWQVVFQIFRLKKK